MSLLGRLYGAVLLITDELKYRPTILAGKVHKAYDAALQDAGSHITEGALGRATQPDAQTVIQGLGANVVYGAATSLGSPEVRDAMQDTFRHAAKPVTNTITYATIGLGAIAALVAAIYGIRYAIKTL